MGPYREGESRAATRQPAAGVLRLKSGEGCLSKTYSIKELVFSKQHIGEGPFPLPPLTTAAATASSG